MVKQSECSFTRVLHRLPTAAERDSQPVPPFLCPPVARLNMRALIRISRSYLIGDHSAFPDFVLRGSYQGTAFSRAACRQRYVGGFSRWTNHDDPPEFHCDDAPQGLKPDSSKSPFQHARRRALIHGIPGRYRRFFLAARLPEERDLRGVEPGLAPALFRPAFRAAGSIMSRISRPADFSEISAM